MNYILLKIIVKKNIQMKRDSLSEIKLV